MESQNRRRAPAWTEREVLDLIAVWGDETVLAELGSKRKGSGEALFPNSQELFLTLEPVQFEPSQGVLDAGEGTSAANISTPPLSSPSQRLAKIRSKKKRSRDEMFSELMESSHSEAAQQNAWRQTLSESR
ncbi:hypothetical protein G0U57_018465 [Chelydra serpentina]|uniref:Uncharacterized protein n=1 Tax=Chelydra serpentina TaxID=8475 RepID=A0A8T1SYS6_CHESE|nr:hypothetical protein G0U57_018465 [Chelydra serpentina]